MEVTQPDQMNRPTPAAFWRVTRDIGENPGQRPTPAPMDWLQACARKCQPFCVDRDRRPARGVARLALRAAARHDWSAR